MHGHHSPRKRLAVISGGLTTGRPAARILFERQEGGFLTLDDRMPEDPAGTSTDDLVVVCEHCLVDQSSEVGAGMDLARRTGGARLVEGQWLEERE